MSKYTIIDYKIVYTQGFGYQGPPSAYKQSEELEKEVKELVSKGWEPIGGITVSEDSYWVQAMVKRKWARTVS